MKKEALFFKSEAHHIRFLAVMQQIGKHDGGTLDPEYASAIYILTSDAALWNKASRYVVRDRLRIPAMLKEVDLSSGYATLVQLAGNLFNKGTHLDPLDLIWVDGGNFQVALAAMQVRRDGLQVDGL